MMLIASLILLSIAKSTHGSVDFVYSVQRHGARNVLPKSALLSETDANGGPTLLPQGQRQTFLAGAAFAERYINTNCTSTSTCLVGAGGLNYGPINTAGVGFNHYNTYIRSSGLDRTLMSANGFFSGMFPANASIVTNTSFVPTGQTIVPVYSQSDANDYIIRGYTKCPAYADALTAWYASAEFAAKANESSGLRAAVQAAPDNNTLQAGGSLNINVSLANWFNVYDSWNVYINYGVGDPMPTISTSLFTQMTALAYWLEVSKMRSSMTQSLIGGAMLGEALSYLNAAQAALLNGTQSYIRLASSSTHYNTQLGLMGALRLDTYAPAVAALAAMPKGNWLATGSVSGTNPKIPSLAAVLLLELVAAPAGSAGVSAVRMLIQDSPTGAYIQVPLPCSVSGDASEISGGVGSCSLPAFNAYAAPYAYNSSADWCAACHNTGVNVCAAGVQASAVVALQSQSALLQAQVSAMQVQAASVRRYVPSWTIAVSVLVTAAGISLIGVALFFVLQKRLSNAGAQYSAGKSGRDSALEIPLSRM